jgi:rhomboid family GlyGly-CTERM serine protease
MSPRLRPHVLPAPLTAALAGSALILLLQLAPAVLPALEYRRAALMAEPWRLLTGHLVHVNWTHALVNAGAWLVLARLFAPQLDARRQSLILALGAAFISLALAARYPSIEWYRGASGALHALFFAGTTTALGASLRERPRRAALIPLALLAGGWIKVVLEQPGGSATPYAEWLAATTVPQAHLLGAVAGTVLGLYFAARARQRPGLSR